MERVTARLNILKVASPPPQEISGSQAAEVITFADHEPLEVVGFDELEAERLGVKKRMEVKVTPDDTGEFDFWDNHLKARN